MSSPTKRYDALRAVIDSNMLESDELRVFLSTSPGNKAILTDFAWVEAYKQDPVRSITSRMHVLKDFPHQVIVLKGIQEIAALDTRAPGLANRMIRSKGGALFAETIAALGQAPSGDPRVIDQILDRGRAAEERMSNMLAGVPDILGALPEMQEQMFTEAEIRRSRAGEGYTRDMVGTILGAADQISEALFSMHPDNPRRPSRRAKIDTYFYRYSLATVLYLLTWTRTGSPSAKKHTKVQNDFIDLSFATFGTYFNGLMTDDTKARSFHLELRHVLGMLGARLPEDYVGAFIAQLRRIGS